MSAKKKEKNEKNEIRQDFLIKIVLVVVDIVKSMGWGETRNKKKSFHQFPVGKHFTFSQFSIIHRRRRWWRELSGNSMSLMWINRDKKKYATICIVERNIYFTPNKFPIVYVFPCTFILFIPLMLFEILHAWQSESTKGRKMLRWRRSTRARVNSVQHRQQQYFRHYAVSHISSHIQCCVLYEHWKWLRNSISSSAQFSWVSYIFLDWEQESRKWNHIINFHYRLQDSKKAFESFNKAHSCLFLSRVRCYVVVFLVFLSSSSSSLRRAVHCSLSLLYTSQHNSVILHR